MKKFIEYQKPMAGMLIALTPVISFSIYNFGWRVLAVLLVANFCSFCCEYWFTSKASQPASMSCLITGTLLALTLPPAIPLWMVAVGAAVAIIFAKMAFGGFAKNIFNPAIVGRCFLYICFPLYLTGSWQGPASGDYAGLKKWLSQAKVKEIKHKSDVVSSATLLTASKRLNTLALAGKQQAREAESAFAAIDYVPLLTGRISGSMGETSVVAILLALLYLLRKKYLFPVLFFSPLIGMLAGICLLHIFGFLVLPLAPTIMLNLFAGGALFACVFMTTEPVSAPINNTARWLYGLLIGFLASIIRSLSVFNAGFMFAILLGNMAAPIIEIAVKALRTRKKAVVGK